MSAPTDEELRILAARAYPDADVRVCVVPVRHDLWRAEVTIERVGKGRMRDSFAGVTEDAARVRLARDLDEVIAAQREGGAS